MSETIELAEVKRRGRPPKPRPEERDYTISVRVIRDFWVGEDRTTEGTVLEMDVMDALPGIASGSLAWVQDAD